jgi:hypothetical protein
VLGRRLTAGTALGTVEVRYSGACHAAWARITPAMDLDRPHTGEVILGITRPVDHASISYHPGRIEQAYTILLRIEQGCVYARATFLLTDGHQSETQTACRQYPPHAALTTGTPVLPNNPTGWHNNPGALPNVT